MLFHTSTARISILLGARVEAFDLQRRRLGDLQCDPNYSGYYLVHRHRQKLLDLGPAPCRCTA